MTHLLMLEDDADRIARFKSVIESRTPSATLTVYRTAHLFIDAYSKLSEPPTLIALDHDLFVDSPNDPDPGDGRDVARFLAELPPACPILIHSTNAAAADSMLFALRDAGWIVERIAPLGGGWIEEYWQSVAAEMIVTRTDR